MTSEVECSDCSPPIPSGYYAIINKVNGNIKPDTITIRPIDHPVVADPIGHIWKIGHIKDYEYHILSRDDGLATGIVPESTVEKGNDLYVEDTVRPEVWIICGEHDSTVNKNVYVIKKKPEFGIPPPPPRKYWNLETPSPGTQVKVTPPPPFPGFGCEVNRVPAEYVWLIEERPPPNPRA